jgi:hypothetical protein
MITFEDCAAFCGLDADQIAAIAEHEHIPHVEAAALASHLLHSAGGEERIHRMIVEDILAALADGKPGHAAVLLAAFRHFLNEHPHMQQTLPSGRREVEAP